MITFREFSGYRVAVIENFLPAPLFGEIQEWARTAPVEKSHGKGLTRQADWHWGPVTRPDILEPLLAARTRSLIETTFGRKIRRRTGCIPQLNRIRGPSGGIPTHLDPQGTADIVMLYQLSQPRGMRPGGDLVFYEKQEDDFGERLRVTPTGNRLVLFESNAHSWHGVDAVQTGWERQNIAVDWEYRPS